MPDPRLATIAESSLTDIETTADAWHLPPSYFAIPTSPTSPRAGSRTPPSPGSPYPCHVSSPLAHSFAENLSSNDVSNATTGTGFKCDSPCIEGIACRFHNTEHPFNRRRKSSMPPSGVWTPIVDVKEIVADEAEKKGMGSCPSVLVLFSAFSCSSIILNIFPSQTSRPFTIQLDPYPPFLYMRSFLPSRFIFFTRDESSSH